MSQKKLIHFSVLFISLFLMLSVSSLFAQTVEIQWAQPRQEIDGFGCSGAFRQADDLKSLPVADQTQILDLLFSQTKGIGMSIVRNMIGDGSMGTWGNNIDGPIDTIEPTKGTWNYTAVDEQIWFMKEAMARGCTRFMSTAWSPPKWLKSNNSCINGGNVPSASYSDYATYLVNYVVEYMKNRNGIDIYAISPANEPDQSTGYSSCNWSGDQFNTFVRDHLGPKMRAASPATKIILGEHSQWTESVVTNALNDAQTVGYVDIVGAHNYGNSTYPKLTTAASKNKRVWETEISNLNNNDKSIGDGVKWAKQVHNFMVNAEGNAFFYWWGMCYKAVNPSSGESLISMDMSSKTWFTNKRLFTIGNFSRFVRPGWVRLTTSATTVGQVSVTAFKNPTTNECVMVAINESGSNSTVQFHFNGYSVTTVTPYLTSGTADLAKQTDITANSSGVFSVTIPGTSVMSFAAGQAAPAKLGDVNGDGNVTIVDAMLIAQYSAGMSPSGFIAANADVTKDGQITIQDALKVAQFAAGIITTF